MNSEKHLFNIDDQVFFSNETTVCSGRVINKTDDNSRVTVMVYATDDADQGKLYFYVDLPAASCYLLHRINMSEKDLLRDVNRYDYINKDKKRDL